MKYLSFATIIILSLTMSLPAYSRDSSPCKCACECNKKDEISKKASQEEKIVTIILSGEAASRINSFLGRGSYTGIENVIERGFQEEKGDFIHLYGVSEKNIQMGQLYEDQWYILIQGKIAKMLYQLSWVEAEFRDPANSAYAVSGKRNGGVYIKVDRKDLSTENYKAHIYLSRPPEGMVELTE